MQETKNSSCYSTVAGALFAFGGVMELFQWLRILRFMSFSDYVQMLIWVASCAVLAFALLTKRRDIFLPVGFALAGIACLFFLNFRNVLLLLGNWGMAFLAVVFVTDYLPQLREQVKKFWFIPPAVVALATVLSIGGVWFVAFLRLLATCAGMFLAAMWVAYPEGLPQQTVSASAETGSTTATPAPEVYCGLVKHILLLLFTCGIWPITMATTELKPGGYQRFKQIGDKLDLPRHRLHQQCRGRRKPQPHQQAAAVPVCPLLRDLLDV